MIRIEFKKQCDLLTGFECKCHTGLSYSGEDVVFAFISSACYMAANTVTEVMSLKADAAATDGYMRLSINQTPDKAQDIMNGLLFHLTELEKQYPKNIKVTTTEV